MIPYQHVQTYGTSNEKFYSAIADIEFVIIDGRRYLFTITQQLGGGIAGHQIDETSRLLTSTDTKPFPKGTTYLGEPKLNFYDNSIENYLFPSWLGVPKYLALSISDMGKLNDYGSIASPEQVEQITAFGQFDTPKGSFVYSAFHHDLSFHIAKIESDGRLKALNSTDIPIPFPHEHSSIDRMLVTTKGDKQFLVAISGLGDFIATYEITDDGKVLSGSLHSGKMQIGYRTPTDGVAVEINGKAFVIAAAAGSSTLTVLQLSDDGKLKAVDHILDERTTRFDKITAIDSVTIDDRAFIFVGGVDDGISVFTLQPNGVLLHLTTIEDTAALTLARVSDIEAQVINDEIEVFVTSAKDTGVTQLRFDPGKIGQTEITTANITNGTVDNDLLIAGKGTTQINGGRGDDILVSGQEPVNLYGGPGADIFVPTRASGPVHIRDFEPGIDRLDFSQLGAARSVYDLKINQKATSAVIRKQDITIKINTKDNALLSKDEFNNSLFPIAHYNTPEQEPVYLPRPTAEELLRPYLLGEIDVDDEVRPDPLLDPVVQDGDHSQPGKDNGALDCFALANLAHDRLEFTDRDDDTKIGTVGDDTLHGGYGHDILIGTAGKDQLSGGVGQDIFVFKEIIDSPTGKGDFITDFKHDIDLIDLRPLNLTFINQDEFSGADELRWFQKGGVAYVQADIDGDKIADLEILLKGRINLHQDDFLL